MYLRKLEQKDASLMLSWMHDSDVTEFLSAKFSEMTVHDAERFISKSKDDSENVHMAVVSDEDEYMGTVSLKHIDMTDMSAEFAISMRREAHGHGYAWFGMTEILEYGFEQLGLECVYWCVSNANKRAVRFYEKHGFHGVVDITEKMLRNYQENASELRWFAVLKGDDYKNSNLNKGVVAGCKVIDIKTIPTLSAGELSVFEGESDIGFQIKRIYYISKVPEGARRGYHAHKKLRQLLFCPYGKIQLILDNGNCREEITLDDPSIGVMIEQPVWREMLWMKKNSVLCVAASEKYDSEDYIRDYKVFKKYIDECK